MIVSCPSCNTQYRLDAGRLKGGRGKLRCARCKTVFPVALDGAPPPVRTREPAAPPAAPGRLEVAVLACDAAASRQKLQGLLQGMGVRVIAADTGPNALDAARRSRPRLVAATFWLPEMTGPELAGALRDEPALTATRVLLVGGPTRAHHWPLDEAALCGADAHVPDDAREADVERALRALLGLPGGAVTMPPDADVRGHARAVVDDLRVYLAAELEEGRRTGTAHPRVAEYLATARLACGDRFPAARIGSGLLEAWDDELRRALRRS